MVFDRRDLLFYPSVAPFGFFDGQFQDADWQILYFLILWAHVDLRSVRVAERLALPTLDHGVVGSNPAGGEILPEPKRRFIAQSLSCSPFHRLEMTEILLKGRKTLTHPSIMWTFIINFETVPETIQNNGSIRRVIACQFTFKCINIYGDGAIESSDRLIVMSSLRDVLAPCPYGRTLLAPRKAPRSGCV